MKGTRYIDLVERSARLHPEKLAVVDAHSQLTFGEVHRRASRFAALIEQAVRAHPDGANQRVALLALNEGEFLEMQTGAIRAGLTLVPLNHRLSDAELEYVLADSQPVALIAGRSFADRAAALSKTVGIPAVWGLGAPTGIESYEDAISRQPEAYDGTDTDPGTPCLLMYTSGTTGRPKGVLIDRKAFSARMLVNLIELEIDQNSVFLQSLPMFHVSGLLGYAHTYGGASMVLLESFDADQYLDLIERWEVTSTALVPTTLSMITDAQQRSPRDMSTLRLLVYGGSSIHPDLLDRAMATFPAGFHQQYGMTETMGGLSILRPQDHSPDDSVKLRSAGTETIGYQVRILDDDGHFLPDNQIGEIACSGPALMKEYLNLPDVTAATLAQGWLRTGDLGFRDDSGFMHVVDRRNNMIITGGENVYPREVEDVLLSHPDVADAAVLGLDDPAWGEKIVAVVNHDAPSDIELNSYVRSQLAGYKVPKKWFRLDTLPRNATGKLQRGELKQQLLDAPGFTEK